MKLIKLAFISTLLTSCIITPPDGSSERNLALSFIRNIEMTCTTPTKCANESARNFQMITIYTTDYCNNFDLDSPILAISGSDITCTDGTCASFTTNFTNGEGHKDFRDIVSGNYTVLVFIDTSSNLYPSNNEPYFCTDEVDINLSKRNTAIAVEITKKYGVEEDD